MAPRLFGKKRRSQDDREADGIDWADFVRQGASVTLALVKEAAEFAPVPGLRQAAGTTLQILSIIQTVKDNKSAFRLLGDEATALIAVIWRSYQTSMSKENWPPAEFKSVIEDLVLTLASINEYAKKKVDRGTAVRWVYSMADGAKIEEYRERLRYAVSKFEVSSHLTIVDAMQRVLKGQRQIIEQLAAKGITVERTETEQILERLKALDINDRSPTNSRSTSVYQEVFSNQQNDPAIGSLHVEVEVSSEERPKEAIDEILAAAERYGASEQKYLAGQKNSKSYRRATVETDDETEDGETAIEDDWQSASDEDSDKLDQKKQKLPPNSSKKRKKSPSPQSTLATESTTANVNGAIMANMHASIGNVINASIGDMNTSMGNMRTSVGNVYTSAGYQAHPQSPPTFQSPSPNPHFPYPLYNPYFSPHPHYNLSSSQPYTPHSPFPGFPPMGPITGDPASDSHTPSSHMNMFGLGTYVNNVNSGNISNTTISGVGNDNRVITYAGKCHFEFAQRFVLITPTPTQRHHAKRKLDANL